MGGAERGSTGNKRDRRTGSHTWGSLLALRGLSRYIGQTDSTKKHSEGGDENILGALFLKVK